MKRTIIAEIGQNHMGDMDLAKELIERAKICGADLAKFQLYDSVKLYGKKQEQELTEDQANELFEFGKQIGIEVFFSVFDLERVRWCQMMQVQRYKIASRSIFDRKFIEEVASYGKPIIVSCPYGNDGYWKWDMDISSLYCVPEYPTRFEHINFQKMTQFDGFSDHTTGIEASQIALVLGAEIIEKHFRLEVNPSSPDYGHSIIPSQLKQLVDFARKVEIAL